MNWGLYIHQARRWFLLALIPALLVTIASYVYVNREAKTYQTTTTLYIQEPSSGGVVPGSTDVYSSEAVIPTYAVMIESPVIASVVDQALAGQFPGYRLENHGLSVQAAGSTPSQPGVATTQLMDITVSDTVPARAAAAADAVARAFIAKATAIQRSRFKNSERAIQRELAIEKLNITNVSQQITNFHGSATDLNNLKGELAGYDSIYAQLLAASEEFDVNRDTALNSVKVFSPAQVPTAPTGPHPLRTAPLLGFVALLVCAAGLYLYDYVDDTPRTPEQIEEVIGSPILGTVQKFNPAHYGTQLVTVKRAGSPLSEAYRVIRTNIQFTDVDHPPRAIVVTSASPTEGKSTTVSNLANVFAEAGRRVMLVDGDLRRPSLHRIFAAERQDGLTNMLVGDFQLNGQCVQQTGQHNLALIAAGPLPPRPADMLGSERMQELIGHLQRLADLVLIDSPPVLAVTDAAILSTVTDGVILVVDPSKSKRRDLRRAREAIEAVDGRILGVVVNRLSRRGSGYYYYYYHHNYGYQYKYDYVSDRQAGDTPKA